MKEEAKICEDCGKYLPALMSRHTCLNSKVVYRHVAQLVAHHSDEVEVVGANPTVPTQIVDQHPEKWAKP